MFDETGKEYLEEDHSWQQTQILGQEIAPQISLNAIAGVYISKP